MEDVFGSQTLHIEKDHPVYFPETFWTFARSQLYGTGKMHKFMSVVPFLKDRPQYRKQYLQLLERYYKNNYSRTHLYTLNFSGFEEPETPGAMIPCSIIMEKNPEEMMDHLKNRLQNSESSLSDD